MDDSNDTASAITRIKACVEEIKAWMVTNKLVLNGDKTVITVRNLGVIFLDKLTLDSHIKNICKTSLFHLKNISNIRSFLPDKAAVQLTHAFVLSRLDYCNLLIHGLHSCSIRRLSLTRGSYYWHIVTSSTHLQLTFSSWSRPMFLLVSWDPGICVCSMYHSVCCNVLEEGVLVELL